MTDDQLKTLMSQLMAKLDEGPNSHLDILAALSQKYEAVKGLGQIVNQISESLQLVRLVLRYMAFDLEATRRERDQLRTMLEDRDYDR